MERDSWLWHSGRTVVVVHSPFARTYYQANLGPHLARHSPQVSASPPRAHLSFQAEADALDDSPFHMSRGKFPVEQHSWARGPIPATAAAAAPCHVILALAHIIIIVVVVVVPVDDVAFGAIW